MLASTSILARASEIAIKAVAAETKGRLAMQAHRNEEADECFIEAFELTQQIGAECGRLGLDMPEAFTGRQQLIDLFQDAAIQAWDEATLAHYAR